MARNFYVLAFLALWTVLCVSASEEGAASVEKEEVKALEVEEILRLPSQRDSIQWEQSPIEIHSFRVPQRPVRFRFGRPGGCHGKFKHFLMPREDPFQPQFSRRMGMGQHRHAHAHAHAHPFLFPALEDVRGDEIASSSAVHVDFDPQREAMGFGKQTERPQEGFMVRAEQQEQEQERGT